MADKDRNKKNLNTINDNDDADGSDGSASSIEFVDFIGKEQSLRDDLAPITKDKLIKQHENAHYAAVKKQKDMIAERKQAKENKQPSNQNGLRGSGNAHTQYKNHPLLGQKAQFSGIDKQVNALPDLNEANTNDEKNNELKYQYSLRYQPQNAPQFSPKLRPV